MQVAMMGLGLGAASAMMPGCAAQSAETDAADEASEGAPQASPSSSSTAPSAMKLNGQGRGVRREALRPGGAPPPRADSGDPGIYYHGGPLIPVVDVYYIFYGNWSSSQVATLTDFAEHLGDSPYYNINRQYGVTGHVAYSGSTTYLGYPWGTAIDDNGVASIVTDAIDNGHLPYDQNGLYLVLTDANVVETSGFCTQYCGWHTSSHLNWFGGPVDRFAFVGNPAVCHGGCLAQSGVSPNGDVNVDSMITVIAHEIEEAATDPDSNGWYDNSGPSDGENADKCAWNFGPTYATPNGARANMRLGTRDYLIQQNWVPVAGVGCQQRYQPSGDFNNGGFESGNLGGWYPSGASVTVSSASPHMGSYAAQVGATTPTNGDSTLAQPLFVPSQGGTLSFWYNVHCPDTLTYDWATAQLYDYTTGAWTTILPPTCTNNNQWQKVSVDLSAHEGHWVDLILTSHDDNYPGDATYTLFDDVAMDN
jgi:hypothetical protein